MLRRQDGTMEEDGHRDGMTNGQKNKRTDT